MRHLDYFLNASLQKKGFALLFALALLFAPVQPVAHGGVSSAPSAQERAMNAARQLRELRRQTALQSKADRGLSQAPAPVSLKVNRGIRSASSIFFYDDMESGAGGWTTAAYTGADLLHQTALDASSPATSWWAGIEPQSDYSNGARINNALTSPAIDLTAAAGSVSLLFAENFYTEKGWDYCMVDVSTNAGGSWTPLRGAYGSAPSGNSGGWMITALDLTPYAGSAVHLRFWFDTGDDKYNAFPGWFVDDVVVFDQGGLITGRKFFDVNNNSVKDIGERGVRDWRITADGPVTFTTKTNERGRYWLPLPLGTYAVSEEFQPNWTQKYPLTGTWSVDLAAPDTVVDSVHFGNYTQASFINGRKYHDLDQDGIFNNADTVLPEWKIVLEDTLGNEINFDRTDSLGEYSLYVFAPGRYVVREAAKAGWVQTAPAGETYTIDIPDLNSVVGGIDFGNFYSPLTNAVVGQKFNDRDRNAAWDLGELPVAGFKIQLWRKGNGSNFNLYRTRTTDSSGYYQFLSLPADTYKVKEIQQLGWWQSIPESSYAVILQSGETADSLDFGNYEIVPGSIGGMKYNDLNDNGVRDSGETALAGWKINLTGSASATATTDANGAYLFAGLYPGSYTVSEVWRDGWRQTYPLELGVHQIGLGPEQDLGGIDFGNVADSAFTATFRTFTYEDLALAKDAKGKRLPVKPIPNKVQFRAIFINGETQPVRKLTVRWGVAILDTLEVSEPGLVLLNDKRNRVEITFDAPVDSGDTVVIAGFGAKAKPQLASKWWWTFDNLTLSAPKFAAEFPMNILRWPMPNAVNLMQQTAAGLRVGLGGPHSIVHPSYKEVLKSLADKPDRLHLGVPRCIDKFSGPTGKSIKKQQKYLTPTRHNNLLFAEAIALQVNIRSSDLLRTPAGFGNLVYDEGTGPALPLNNLSVREIAAALDEYMSSYDDSIATPACTMPASWSGLSPDTLYDRIRRINGAFDGPLDTVGFATGLKFRGVGGLDEVSFLRYDPAAANRPGTYYTTPMVAEIPQEMELYQNYPNPFNPTTTIEFYLPVQGLVTMKIYNMLGQEVATIFDRVEMEDGYQDAEFDAGSLGSGVYFYRLVVEGLADEESQTAAGKYTQVRKMMLMK